MTPQQGEIWWAEAEDKRRPVLVVTRSVAVAVLNRILVAPVTTTIRPIPTHIALSADEGLGRECAATFDNLQLIPRAWLTTRVGTLPGIRRHEICRALEAVADC